MDIEVIADFTPELLAAISNVWEKRMQNSPWSERWGVSSDYLQWLVGESDEIKSAIALIINQGEILGTCSVIRKSIWIDNKAVQSAEIGNIFVAPSLRGKGLFKSLVTCVTDFSKKNDIDFVYCMPNHQGAEALCRSGSYVPFNNGGSLPIVIPLNVSQLIRSKTLKYFMHALLDNSLGFIANAVAGRQQNRLHDDIPKQVPSFSSSNLVFHGAKRNLDHRVRRHPEHRSYGLLQSPDGDGWAVIRRCSFRNCPFLLIGDIQAKTPSTRAKMLRNIAARASQEGFLAIAMWVPKNEEQDLIRAGLPFFPLRRKKCIVLNTNLTQQLIQSGMTVRIPMLDTDKI